MCNFGKMIYNGKYGLLVEHQGALEQEPTTGATFPGISLWSRDVRFPTAEIGRGGS